MGPFEMVVAIVLIGCLTGMFCHVVDALKAYATARTNRGQVDAMVQEALRQVLEELARLHQKTNDAVLSFDATLQRMEARLQHVEQRGLGAGSRTSQEEQRVVAGH